MRRVGVEPVVAPAPFAREGRDRHQLDRRHAELAEAVEVRNRAAEGACRAEGADVQLVDHELGEGQTRPAVVAPLEGTGVDYARRAADALGLKARARVGPLDAADGGAC